MPTDIRGVDLSAVLAKSRHKHHWAVTAVFGVDVNTIEAMAERRLSMVNLFARDKTEEAMAVPGVDLPMGNANMITTSGPGCIKCGVHWEDPDNGHGHGCPVSDDEWAAQFNQQEQQQNDMLGSVFGYLVNKARGETGSGLVADATEPS